MALPPGTGGIGGTSAATVGGFTPAPGPLGGFGGSNGSFIANLPGWGAPSFQYPDYNALLEQYMGPFRQIYEAQINALQGNIDRQMQYARRQEGLAEDQVGLTRDRLGQQHQQAVQNILNTITARGLADSGEMPYQRGQEKQSYDRSVTSLDNQLESLKNQLANTLAGLQAQLDQSRFAGLMGLQQQQLSLLPFIQSTYQPTITPRNPGDAQALAGTLGQSAPPPPIPPPPVVPLGVPSGVLRAA